MTVLNPYFYALNPNILAYENAWVNYMNSGEKNDMVIRDVIFQSWERCKSHQLQTMENHMIQNVGESDLFMRIGKNQSTLSVVAPFIDTIYEEVKGSGFAVLFADCDSIVLRCDCDKEFQEICSAIKLMPGANMAEASVGTNSIDLSAKTKKPISVTGAEHYKEMFHNLSASSVPIFDYSGTMLGILSVWCKHEHATPHILNILIASAHAVENEMQIKKINEQLFENNNQLTAILQSVSDGVVYVKDGIITQINEEMLGLLGKSNSEINKKNIESVIITSPEIGRILKNRSQNKFFRITLYGTHSNYKCIVNKASILGSDEKETGQVIIFKEVEEINNLLKSLNKNIARWTFDDIIGDSKQIKETENMARKAAEHDSRIIIQGESGTGKEMFAQAIHNASNRWNGPFVAVDCGAIPAGLFESTLFGYEKGAFTGANKSGEAGSFETANHGTLFLDEIENLPIDMQVKLLRVLQENSITRVGGNSPIAVDIRIIAATNVDLKSLVDSGKFREDLYYRLNVINITTPPLRERKSDIPLLIKTYLEKNLLRNKKMDIEKSAINILQKYDWPGNVRQLYNAIERAGIMASKSIIKESDLPLEIRQNTEDEHTSSGRNAYAPQKEMTIAEMNRQYARYILEKNNNNISKTAKILGLSRATVYKMIEPDK